MFVLLFLSRALPSYTRGSDLELMCSSVYLKLSIQSVFKLRSDLGQQEHKCSLAHRKELPTTAADSHQKKRKPGGRIIRFAVFWLVQRVYRKDELPAQL